MPHARSLTWSLALTAAVIVSTIARPARAQWGFSNEEWSTSPFVAIDWRADGHEEVVTGDFDGNGRLDIAHARSAWGAWRMNLSTGTGFVNQDWSTSPYYAIDWRPDGHEKIVTGDFNGDGRTDIAHARSMWGAWRISLSTGSGFVVADWSTSPYYAIDWLPYGHEEVVTGDFDGNGCTDLAHAVSGWMEWRVSLSTCGGFITSSWSTWPFYAIDWRADGHEEIVTGDFNGDGRTDIAHARSLWGAWRVMLSNGGGFVVQDWSTSPYYALEWRPGGNEKILVGDFDGNGRDDIAHTAGGWDHWRISLSTGASFSNVPWSTSPYLAADYLAYGHVALVAANLDGNGRTDIAQAASGWDYWRVSRSTGSGFVTTEWSSWPYLALYALADGHEQVLTGDFTGDGRDDLVDGRSLWGAWHVSRSTGPLCGNGVVESGEQCDGGPCCQSTCTFRSAGTVCLARDPGNPCDVDDACTGSSASCPTTAAPAGTICRASAGPCDPAETCNGTLACPANTLSSSGTICRASAGSCDVAETCTGSSATCSADAFVASGTVCRAATDVCDVTETCSGSSASCPIDQVEPSTTVCRASAGPCDVAETCPGPASAKTLSSGGTRTGSGSRSITTTSLDSASKQCPADQFVSSGTVCRAAVDVCDLDETCSGTSATCPTDALAAAGTECRPSTGSCDPAETCDGSTRSCPADGGASCTGYLAHEVSCEPLPRPGPSPAERLVPKFGEFLPPDEVVWGGPGGGERLNMEQEVKLLDDCLEPLQGKEKNFSGCTVTLNSGAFSYQVDALELVGRNGRAFNFVLSYRSRPQNDGTHPIRSNVGTGWSHSYEARLQREGDDYAYYTGNGRWEAFGLVNPGAPPTDPRQYVAGPGRYVMVEESADGLWATLTHYDDGMQEVYYVPNGLRDRVTWPNGDQFSFTYTDMCNVATVTDHHGRVYTFRHDRSARDDALRPIERLVKVDDPTGRNLRLTYCDGNEIGVCSRGALRTISGPDTFTTPGGVGSATTRQYAFEYDGNIGKRNNNLLRVFTPGQTFPSVTSVYGGIDGSPSFNRVVEQTCASPSPYRFLYSPPEDPTFCARDVTVIDPIGARTDYDVLPIGYIAEVVQWTGRFDAGGAFLDRAGLRPMGSGPGQVPASYVTSYVHNLDGEVLETIQPDGTRDVTTFYEPVAPATGFISPVEWMKRARVTQRALHAVGASGLAPLITTFSYDERSRLLDLVVTETSPLGQVTQDVYDDRGNLIETHRPVVAVGVTLPQSAIERFEYNAFGQTTRRIDAEGSITEMAYQDGGAGYLIVTIEDAGRLNLRTDFERDARGNATAVTGPDGVIAYSAYDELDRVVDQWHAADVSARGPPTTTPLPSIRTWFFYDARGDLIETHAFLDNPYTTDDDSSAFAYPNPQRVATRFEYDLAGDKLAEHRENGAEILTTRWEYDALHRTTAEVSAAGRNTEWTHDELGRVLSVTRGARTSEASTVTFDYYVDTERTLRETDPRGHSTTWTFDAYGRSVGWTDATGARSEHVLDADGRLLEEVTLASVDGLGPPVIVSSRRYEYDERGRQVAVESDWFDTATGMPIDSGRVRTETRFDRMNRVVEIIDAAVAVTRMQYDGAGRIVLATEPNGDHVTTEYDPAGRPVVVTTHERDPSTGAFVAFATRHEYDAAGRAVRSEDNAGHATHREYDSLGNLTREVDARGNETAYEYDAQRRLLRTDQILTVTGRGPALPDPTQAGDGRITTTTVYDPDGLVVERRDDEGVLVNQIEYTARGRVQRALFADGSSEWHEYDLADNETATIDGNGTRIEREFDAEGRVTRVSVNPAAGNPFNVIGTSEQTFQYSGHGLLVRATDDNDPLDPDDDHEVTVAYDSLMRPIATIESLGAGPVYTTRARHDPGGNVVELEYPGGTILLHDYDATRRLIRITDAMTGEIVAELAYQGSRYAQIAYGNGTLGSASYDAVQRPAAIDHQFADGRFLAFAYQYDEVGNPTAKEASHSAEPGFAPIDARVETYRHDSIGRLTETLRDGGSEEGWAYDGRGNRLSDLSGRSYTSNELNQYVDVGGVSLGYDRSGATTTDGDLTYAYDGLGRLREVARAGTLEARYAYGAGGHRVTRSDSAGATRFLIWDDRVLEERDASGAIVATFVHTEEDHLLQVRRDADTLTIHRDILGSTVAVSDGRGVLIEGIDYSAFGASTVRAPDGAPLAAASVDRLFTGRELDSTIGLYYNRARYYDPDLGRFLNRDPIRYGLNWYAYAENNPVLFTDPTGLAPRWLERARKKIGNAFGDVVDEVKAITIGVQSEEVWREGLTAGRAHVLDTVTLGTVEEFRERSEYYLQQESPETAGFLRGTKTVTKAAIVTAVVIGTAGTAAPVITPATATVIATGGAGAVGAVDPHPPGMSPLDVPGPVDDAVRGLKRLVSAAADAAPKVAGDTARIASEAAESVSKGDGLVGSIRNMAKAAAKEKRAATVAANKARGKAFEAATQVELEKTHDVVASQVTIVTEGGTRTVLDFLVIKDGNICIVECKTGKATLTRAQTKAFEEIASGRGGATVRGKKGAAQLGRPDLRIPPGTKIEIRRQKRRRRGGRHDHRADRCGRLPRDREGHGSCAAHHRRRSRLVRREAALVAAAREAQSLPGVPGER